MLETVKLDEKGRVNLGSDIAREYGRRFYAIKAKGEIVLIPIPKDPVKALQEEGRKLPKNVTMRQLKVEARKLAEEEAWGNWARLQKLAKHRVR